MVAAYGLILPKPILDAPKRGCLNVHASLLPRWRGAAPIQRAILAGDEITGVTIMRMDEGLDTGPMLLRRDARHSRQERRASHGRAGGARRASCWSSGSSNPDVRPSRSRATARPMPPRSTRPRRGSTGRRPADEIERQVRAFAPVPGAWFEVERRADQGARAAGRSTTRAGQPGKVLDDALTIACGEGAIRPLMVQRAGRGAMSAGRVAARLSRFPAGTILPVTRLRLTVEYDGGPFMGWQRQDHGPSVQQALEEAIAAHDRRAGRGSRRRADRCRRPRAGDDAPMSTSPKTLTAHRLREGLNALVRPQPVAVLAAETVADDWHARFSCIGRRYLYRILNRRAPLALDAGRAGTSPCRSTPTRCSEGAAHLVGRHDFTTFRSAHCQSDSPVKTLDRLDVGRVGEEIQIEAAARSFLHHQVRSMVGCLALVGRGQWQPDDMRKALEARDRAALGLQRAAGRASISSRRSIRKSAQAADYSAAIASYSWAARYFSASSAAMQPVPAAVTAWR